MRGASKPIPPETVSAAPTKRFFVEMLTRDIELQDAILDLLDNCIDGIVRSTTFDLKKKKPYSGYWAKIQFDADHFCISDNCGGISRKLAEESAFMLGRPENYEKLNEEPEGPTVGVYGIGMKRAIFKMGRDAEVTSQTDKEAFRVSIPKSWFEEKDNWSLPLRSLSNPLRHAGTTVTVKSLVPQVARTFSDVKAFSDRLVRLISESYSLIIDKGFTVSVNDAAVLGAPLILHSVELRGYKRGIAPYLFRGNIDGVEVDLKLGFYRTTIDEDELEDESTTTHSAHDAGWTVVCNDRVILYRDKSRLTGWGEANVPSYHAQFNAIAGIVHFRSSDAAKLPITTTKRGIDGGSDVYLQVKDKMREALKKFTAFTNRFKVAPDYKKQLFSAARTRPVSVIDDMSAKVRWKPDPKIRGAKFFVPALPELDKIERLTWVKFTRNPEEIALVSEFLFEKSDVEPSKVGEGCFDRVRAEATKA